MSARLIALIGVPIAVLLFILWVFHSGETSATRKVTAAAAVQHTARVAEAHADEHQAQTTTDAIGASVSRVDDATTALVRSKLEEMHDAIDTPPTADGAPATIDTDRMSASLDALVDRANRAASAADAQR